MEIQIRTHEMHKVAEEGIAAHWAYKEGRTGYAKDQDSKFAWLRQLMEWQQDLKDPKEFLETVKVDLFTDEVFVFTPRGDVIDLPQGATPVDFAYAIHTQIGERCVGAKVNGKIVPLRYRLKNGDTVEILTSPNAFTSKDWLTFVKTSRAQTRIRAYIKQQQREKAIALGRDLLERELRRYGMGLGRVLKRNDIGKIFQDLGVKTPEELYSSLGYGKISPSQVIQLVVPPEKLQEQQPKTAAPVSRLTEIFRRVAGKGGKSGVKINGIDDVMVRFGRCCNPVPGDEVVGFITRGRGVTVHTANCDRVLATDQERRVDVQWDVRVGDFKRPVTVRVLTSDRPGLLADISQKFSAAGVNISQANCRSTGDDRAVNTFEVAISDLKQLQGVMTAIERIKGVYSVERV
jgi:GTP pyrophosphokinase